MYIFHKSKSRRRNIIIILIPVASTNKKKKRINKYIVYCRTQLRCYYCKLDICVAQTQKF